MVTKLPLPCQHVDQGLTTHFILGTEYYDASKGEFVDIGILDVFQIFGRAGRPQFDTSGHGIIITAQDKLHKYLMLVTQQHPIESQFTKSMEDNLNAEICLGTVSCVHYYSPPLELCHF